MNIQLYTSKNIKTLHVQRKGELDTAFITQAMRKIQQGTAEMFFEWLLIHYKKKFSLQDAAIFFKRDGTTKICGDDILGLKSFFRLSHQKRHIVASNFIATDPRNTIRTLTGKCIQVPFITKKEVVGSIVYFRSVKSPDFTDDEILTITGHYSQFIGNIVIDWVNKDIKFGAEIWDFVKVMAHEMRTPLNGISGMIHLMSENNRNLTNDQCNYMRMMSESNVNLLTIVNDMIDYSKLQNNQFPLKNEKFSIGMLMQTCMEIVNSADHHVTIVNKSDNYDFLIGDKQKILQILISLLTNAVKHSGETAVTIVSQVTFPRDGLSVLEIDVADNGKGIGETDLEHIFTPFYKSNPESNGMGLGLAIVKSVLALMGGSISVETELGKGASFKVKIPVEIECLFDDWFRTKKRYFESLKVALFVADKTLMTQYKNVFTDYNIHTRVYETPPDLRYVNVLITDSSDYSLFKNMEKTMVLNCTDIKPIRNILFPYIFEHHDTRSVPKKDLKDLRIMLVDDDKVNRFYVKEVLKGLGVGDDQMELKLCRSDDDVPDDDYDIYFMDSKITGGKGLVSSIRSSNKKKHFRVIGMSSGVQEPLAGVFDSVMTKPFNRSTIADVLNEHISRKN